jgi:hypothetical protein
MPRTSRLALLALVVAAALVPACGSDTPSVPEGVLRARIVLSVAPSPLAPIATPPVYSLRYTVTITEANGLGGELEYVNGTVFDDASGVALAFNNYDSSDLLVFVGTKRIDAGGSRPVTQQIDYALADPAQKVVLTINIQFKDDRGNFVSQSILVRVS